MVIVSYHIILGKAGVKKKEFFLCDNRSNFLRAHSHCDRNGIIAGSFRVSLFIDLGMGWRGTLSTFMISGPI